MRRQQQQQAASRVSDDGGNTGPGVPGSKGGSPRRESPQRGATPASGTVRQSSPSRRASPPNKPPRKMSKSRPPRPPLPTAPAVVPDEGTFILDSLSHETSTPFFVYALTLLSALGGFLFGYDTGVISGAMILLRDYFKLNSVWQELIVSVTVAAAAVFALVGGFLNDRIGRRPVIAIASLIFTVGSLIMGLATERVTFLVGRVVVGAGIGLTSTTIPMYIAESAPARHRGGLVSTNVVMIAFGQFIANVVDGIFSRMKEDGWRYMVGLAAIPALLQFIGFLFMPESPRWLITKGEEDQARMVLQRIRGDADIDDEFYKIRNSCEEAEMENQSRSNKPILWQMIQTPAVRRALIIGCSLQMFQQLAGINTVMYYSATIIKMSGVKSEESAIWLSAVTAAVNFVFTLVGVFLVEKIGRRPLTIASLVGAVVSLTWLGVGFYLSAINTPDVTVHELGNQASHCDKYTTCNSCMTDLYCGYCYQDDVTGTSNASCLQSDYNDPVTAITGRCNATNAPGGLSWAYDYCPTAFAWMPMMGLIVYLLFFAPGMGPMPWTINSEIYPLWARSTGNSIATFTNWIFNLAVSMSFLSLTESLTRYGTFWLYAIVTLFGLVWICFFLPETKGKSLEEVEGLFARPWCGGGEGGGGGGGPPVPYSEKTVQYVHIRGLNRDGRESELESPE